MTQMKFITKKNAEGELVKTYYPMGYNMQKELHYRKFNECFTELYKVMHYRKLRLVLHNPYFKLRNKAVRCGVAYYQFGGVKYEFVVDDFKLAILQARQFGVYNNCYYTIKNNLQVNRINPKKDIPYWYDDDFEIRNDKGLDIMEHKDGEYTIYADGEEEWKYRVLSNDNNGIDEAIVEYLTENDGIYHLDMRWLKDYIKDDIKYYEIDAEDDDEEVFDDADRVECPCCMEKFDELPQGIDTRTIRCGHTFCEPCINNWINQDHNTCPLCRKDIEVETQVERDNDELRNYMQQETAGSILENWFDDKWEMIDAMKEEDGVAHILGYDDGETIDNYHTTNEFERIMFRQLASDSFEVLWME